MIGATGAAGIDREQKGTKTWHVPTAKTKVSSAPRAHQAAATAAAPDLPHALHTSSKRQRGFEEAASAPEKEEEEGGTQ